MGLGAGAWGRSSSGVTHVSRGCNTPSLTVRAIAPAANPSVNGVSASRRTARRRCCCLVHVGGAKGVTAGRARRTTSRAAVPALLLGVLVRDAIRKGGRAGQCGAGECGLCWCWLVSASAAGAGWLAGCGAVASTLKRSKRPASSPGSWVGLLKRPPWARSGLVAPAAWIRPFPPHLGRGARIAVSRVSGFLVTTGSTPCNLRACRGNLRPSSGQCRPCGFNADCGCIQ